jgi:hypothetical protein
MQNSQFPSLLFKLGTVASPCQVIVPPVRTEGSDGCSQVSGAALWQLISDYLFPVKVSPKSGMKWEALEPPFHFPGNISQWTIGTLNIAMHGHSKK